MTHDTDPHSAPPVEGDPAADDRGPSSAQAEVARSLLNDLSGGHARIETRETDGHLAAAARIPAHRPPRPHDTPADEPPVMLRTTEPMGLRSGPVAPPAAAKVGSDLAGMTTVVSVRRRREHRGAWLAAGAGVVLALVAVGALVVRRERQAADAPLVPSAASTPPSAVEPVATSMPNQVDPPSAPSATGTGASGTPSAPRPRPVGSGVRPSASAPTSAASPAPSPPSAGKPAPSGTIQEPERTF